MSCRFKFIWLLVILVFSVVNSRFSIYSRCGSIVIWCTPVYISSWFTGIDIYINSYGGYCYDGLALIDTIQSCEYATIRTHAIGKIMSMGLMIYLAGDERYARPYATFMAHSVSSGTWGKLFEMNTEVKEVKRLQEILCDMFAENTKHDAKWWQRHTKYEDRYYDTEKAKELGIVSHDYDNFGKIKDED